jgi:hypothetical protein
VTKTGGCIPVGHERHAESDSFGTKPL